MVTKWELAESFSEDFPDRWKLLLQGEREDAVRLSNVLAKLNFSCGRPTFLREKEYNWCFYLYKLSGEDKDTLPNIMADFNEDEGNFDFSRYIKVAEEKITVSQESESFLTETKKEDHSEDKEIGVAEISEEQKVNLLEEVGLHARYNFDTFVVGKNNHFAKAAALAVAEMPGKVYNPLFVYGDVGLGKTHLMQAIGVFVLSNNPKAKIIYTTAERFMAEVIDAIRYGKIVEFRNKYRKMDLLLIDDIQFLSEAEAAQEEFYHTFNILYDDHKQIVIASDKPPKKISVLEERLRSRFEWGLITDIQSPNLETRVAILKAKAEITKMQIDDEVLYFIAEQLKANIRELEGFLIRIVAYSLLTKRQINKKLAEELLQDLLPEEATPVETDTLLPLEEALSQPPPSVQPKKEETKAPDDFVKTVEPVVPVQEANIITPASPPPSAKKPIAVSPIDFTPSKPVVSPASKPVVEEVGKTDDARVIKTGYVYPAGQDKELNIMLKNFVDTIKKHKIKFILTQIFAQTYAPQPSLSLQSIVESCKKEKVELLIWMGPPPELDIIEGEFVRYLHSTFDKEKIPLQYISFESVPRQYKYLNMVLDFAFIKK